MFFGSRHSKASKTHTLVCTLSHTPSSAWQGFSRCSETFIGLLRVVVELDRSLLDTKRLQLSLDQHQHLCGSLMFYPTLSEMYGVGASTVFIYVFDGVSCEQSSINMSVLMVCPYVWDTPVYVCLIKRVWHLGVFDICCPTSLDFSLCRSSLLSVSQLYQSPLFLFVTLKTNLYICCSLMNYALNWLADKKEIHC